MRNFGAKKKKRAAASDEAASEEVEEVAAEAVEDAVEEVVAEPTPEPIVQETVKADFSAATTAQDMPEISKDLFGAFSLGDIPHVESAPDNKPPSVDDTMEGRYAAVLFTSASQEGALYTVLEDVVYLQALFKNSEACRNFTQNAGVGAKEIALFNEGLKSIGDFHATTLKFLEVLAENKRLVFLNGIADRYQKLYKELNREEKITIISAETLTTDMQDEVLAALKANPQNSGKQFNLEFTIDPTIKGGLQMYTETEFMDMSLATRVNTLRGEIARMVE